MLLEQCTHENLVFHNKLCQCKHEIELVHGYQPMHDVGQTMLAVFDVITGMFWNLTLREL